MSDPTSPNDQYITDNWGGDSSQSRGKTIFGGDDYNPALADEFDRVVSGDWCK